MTFRTFISTTVFTAGLLAAPVFAQSANGDLDRLYEVLQLDAVTEIMQQEGTRYGATIGEDMFPDRLDGEWDLAVAQIYDLERMQDKVRADFAQSLTDADIAPILAYFETAPGQTFVTLEISARRAMLDEAVKDASEDSATIARADRTPRFQMIAEFIETNDLIEPNVVGALNSNYAFYVGLMDGDAFGGDLSEDQILTDVWTQEPDIRANSTDWLFSFLLMAYDPMSDDDLADYIAFSKTDAGAAVNLALFEAFDEMFEGISYQLGRAAADVMTAQDL